MDQDNKYPKSPSSPGTDKNDPKKSGSVKGPKGVGSPASSSGGRVKESASGNQKVEDKREISATPAGGTIEEPTQEPTSKTEEPLKLKPSKRDQKTSEKARELKSGEPIALSDSQKEQEQASMTKKDYADQHKEPEEEQPVRKAAQKMSRRKQISGISAEEKLKLSNSSPSQQLRDRLKGSANELFDTLKPNEELQDELAKLLLQLVPSSDHIKSSVPSQDHLTKVVRMMNEQLAKGKDELDELLGQIQDEELRQKITAAIRKSRRDTT